MALKNTSLDSTAQSNLDLSKETPKNLDKNREKEPKKVDYHWPDSMKLRSIAIERILKVFDKKNINDVKQFLSKKKISFAVLGKFSGDQINIRRKSKNLAKFKINLAQKRYFNGLGDLLKHG